MFQRNVAKRVTKISTAFLLMSSTVFLSQPIFAQSWGQLKEAAAEASGKKDFSGAEQYWKKSLEVAGSSGARYVQSVAGLAKMYADSGKPEQAEELYKKLEAAANPASLGDDERSALMDYAQFLKQKGSAEQSLALEKKFSLGAKVEPVANISAPPSAGSSAADAKAAIQKDYANWSSAFKSGSEAMEQKNFVQAEKLLKEALPIAEKYSESSSMASTTLAKLEELCAAQGKNADGESYAMRKVAAVRMTKGPMSKEFAQALMAHAGWLRKLNRKAEAISEEGKAESILAHISPRNTAGAASTGYAPTGIDASGARGGSIYSRAKAVQGFGGMLNNMLNSTGD